MQDITGTSEFAASEPSGTDDEVHNISRTSGTTPLIPSASIGQDQAANNRPIS